MTVSRGFLWGCLFSAVIWAIIAALVWLVIR
jgi:hypothetical protein